MATIMEKDVLLEIAQIGHLFPDIEETPVMDADAREMDKIYLSVLETPFDQIDFDATVAQIKALRGKYEKHQM